MNMRPFGVEIECGSYTYDYYEVEEMLEREGLISWAEMGVDCDGSGIEIRSPKLVGRKGMNELGRVMAMLNDRDFYTGEEDGMHVHHDISDLKLEDLHRISLSWLNNQDHIHKLVDEYRVDNRWCNRLSMNDIRQIELEIDQREKGIPHASIDYYSSERVRHEKYKALSLSNRYHDSTETIELRLHEGTLDFERAKAWILFGQAFITNTAKADAPLKPLEKLSDLFRAVKPYKAAKEYYAHELRAENAPTLKFA